MNGLRTKKGSQKARIRFKLMHLCLAVASSSKMQDTKQRDFDADPVPDYPPSLNNTNPDPS